MQLIILTGMSGAGKTCALKALEDMGFICMDNLPAQMLSSIQKLYGAGSDARIAVITDVRTGALFDCDAVKRFISEEHMGGTKPLMVFMDADDNCLKHRYKISGREHPLSHSHTLDEAIARERTLMEPLRECANHVIDTNGFTLSELRNALECIVGDMNEAPAKMRVRIISFGFKHGTVQDADMVLDVRMLKNPYYLPEMRARTGRDADVRDYVLNNADAREFLDKTRELLSLILPRFDQNGRVRFTLAVGCTGGQHRSVATAEALGRIISDMGFETEIEHRDMVASRDAEQRIIARTSGG